MPKKRRSEEHTSELQSRENLVCRLLLEKKKNIKKPSDTIKKKLMQQFVNNITTKPQHSTTIKNLKHLSNQYKNSELFTFFFFFNDTATTEIYTLSLHDALPI